MYGVCFFAKIFISIASKYYRKEEGFMNLSRFAKKLMVLIVSVFMFLGSLSINSYQVNAEETPEGTVRVTDGITWEKVDNSTIKGLEPKNVTEEDLSDAGLIKDGSVRVSILVDGDSTIDAGYSAQGIATNASAKAYRAQLLANQQSLAAKISKEVLNGQALDVVWNITLAGNIISANVPYAKIERIKRVAGVKDVVIENQYSAADPVVSDDPNMAVATDMTGTTLVLSDYTGAGQAVAIIDTGLDTDHRSFDPEAFDYAIASLDEEVDLIDKRDVAAVFDELNASQRLSSAKAADVYLSTKVPFAFNYVDSDLDVTHDNDGQGEHGSHVAGIAAANRYVKNADGEFVAAIDEVKTQGQAPDAQILPMKVFGKGGGAYDSDYFAAIEDAMVLGAASANLSLGSSNAGYSFNTTYAEILSKFAENDTVVVMSAGNNYYWQEPASSGYPYAEDSNYATGGSPGSFTNSFTVASIDNDGFIGTPIVVDGENIFFDDGASANNKPMATMPGEFGYIAIDGVGTAEEMAALASVLEGKVAVVSRGSTSFFEKANAAVENGAVATIIYNNQPGTISMNLTGYLYEAPAVSITAADGALLKEKAEKKETEDGAAYYEGTLTITDGLSVAKFDSEYLTMSDFSSWGTTGDLNLKPEITAPGGNIWSVNGAIPGGQAYEIMSGTSMAAPQVTGLTALAHQYIAENDLVAKTGLTERQLTMSLMMSTATPVVEEDSGSYYAVLKQGAGLANIAEMTRSNSFITMKGTAVNGEAVKKASYDASYADGKVKAMLGDDPDRTGKYSVTFDVTNFTGAPIAYDFSADFFTQDIFDYDEVLYKDTWTTPLDAVVTFDVNGEALEAAGEDLEGYDFDDNGLVNAFDAVALLQYVVGTREAIAYEENADLDADGEIDTYDAYLALDMLSEYTTEVKPNSTITVTANIDLNGSLDELGAEEFSGNYVEGYIWVKESTTDEGVEGVDHSIPVLGYFGNWSTPSFHDVGSHLEYTYGLEDRAPYMYVASSLGERALDIESFGVKYAKYNGTYYFGGNPQMDDETYHPERNAINAKDTLANLTFTQIRNSGAGRFTVEDEDGEVLAEMQTGSAYAAYYYRNQSTWQGTQTNVSLGYKATGVEEGTNLTFKYTLAPEYYVENGAVDWDKVDDKNALTISATVDNTAPEFVGDDAVALIYDYKSQTFTGLEVTVADNQYISAIGLFDEDDNLIDAVGAEEEAEAGETRTVTFEITEETPAHLYVAVYDYALNETLYKINLNPEELDGDYTVTLDTDELSVLLNSTARLKAKVLPWGADDSVTWTSADESIATVDEEGIVTGVAEGTTTVTATSVADPNASATATVIVKTFDIPMNGVVWDENGEVWFSEFNTNSLPNYNKLSGSMRLPLASVTYDENGTMYAASFDSDEWTSSLYTVDEKTFETTEIGGSDEIGYMDIAMAPSLGTDYLMAVYGTYVVIVNKTTGDYEGAFDLSSYTSGNYLVGIAYEEQYVHPTYGATDWYWLVDEAGTVYNAGFLKYGTGFSRFAPSALGTIADGVDTPYFQSLYYNGTDLFWSRFSNADNNVQLIMVEDLYNDGTIWNVGKFADGVWPVGGLYEAGEYQWGLAASSDKSGAVIEAEATKTVEKLTRKGLAAKGGLNTVEKAPEDSAEIDAKKGGASTNGTSGVITSTIDVTTDTDATNGLYTVEYDPELVEIISVKGMTQYNAINDAEAGEIKVGFISEEALAEGTEVAEITLKLADPKAATTVTITTEEENDEKPGKASFVDFGTAVSKTAEGTLKVRLTGDDWGAGVDKAIIKLDSAVKAEDVSADLFEVTQSVNNGAASARTVLDAYTSDAEGNKVDEDSEYITIDMRISPVEGSPIVWSMQTWTNSWANPYVLDINLKDGKDLETADGTIRVLDIDGTLDFSDVENEQILIPQLDGYVYDTYEAEDGLVVPYGLYAPAEDDKKNALIIWNHGVGERGSDPRIALLGNEVTALNGEEFQAIFEGAYVLVPQTPANTAGGNIVTDKIELVKKIVEENPDIDADRVIVGGCSMGGGQTMSMIFEAPELFAAAYPICPATNAGATTDEQIAAISSLPIWFTHCINDDTVGFANSSPALIEKLQAAGNENVHWSFYDDVHDTTGRFNDLTEDGSDYQYSTHWSWVYFDNNENTCDDCGENEWVWLAQQRRTNATEIAVDPAEITITVGETYAVEAVLAPEGATAELAYASADEAVATVDEDGNIFGKKVGSTTVTVTTDNGLSADIAVKVLFTDVPETGKYYSDPVYWAVENGITNGFTDEDGLARTFGPEKDATRAQMVTFLWRLAGKPEPSADAKTFPDVDKNSYYYKAVLWASEQGITHGYADGTFKPDESCLREHAVTFLYRMAGSPAPKTTVNPFNDVKASDYFYKATLWANEEGIAKGYSTGANAGGFGPKLTCLREHIVTFMYRYAK